MKRADLSGSLALVMVTTAMVLMVIILRRSTTNLANSIRVVAQQHRAYPTDRRSVNHIQIELKSCVRKSA